jgi:hypothetical protein
MSIIRYSFFFILACSLLAPALGADTNIDPTGAGNSYAWTQGAGWINLRGDVDQGVRVGASVLKGYAWSESVGWIFFGDGTPQFGPYYSNANGEDIGVNRQNDGSLTGYAWAPSVGWIIMDTSGAGGSQVRVDPLTGIFSGYAWCENVGWIAFDGVQAEFVAQTVPVDDLIKNNSIIIR